jgi:hypothetical protein
VRSDRSTNLLGSVDFAAIYGEGDPRSRFSKGRSRGAPDAAAPSRTHVIEIATYPERRAAEQALRDLQLVYLVRGEVSNVLVLVLRRTGKLRVPNHAQRLSSDGVTALECRWPVVELWTVLSQRRGR